MLFQETFLRALRAYGRLEHGEHLRAWVLTIASRIAVVDAARRERPTAELSVEPAGEDERPAFEELAPLTDDLPPKERAAVVLRYGYDLDYDDDRRRARLERAGGATGGLRRRAAAAEGEGAAMTAVSHRSRRALPRGCGRGRRCSTSPTTCSTTRPSGALLVGVTGARRLPDRLRPRAGAPSSSGSPGSSARASCAPRTPLDRVRRELDEYFAGRRHALRPRARPPRDCRSSTGASSQSSHRVEYGHDDDVRHARRAGRRTRAPRGRSAP